MNKDVATLFSSIVLFSSNEFSAVVSSHDTKKSSKILDFKISPDLMFVSSFVDRHSHFHDHVCMVKT